jgi:hypothetical protein
MLKDPDVRRAVLALLAQGMITIPEAARLGDVSRPLIRHWCKRAEIDWRKARAARLLRAWNKELSRKVNRVHANETFFQNYRTYASRPKT